MKSPGTAPNFSASSGLATTQEIFARSVRSAKSAGPSMAVAGLRTKPPLMQASMVSHSSTWLLSMSITRSPRLTPTLANQLASCPERADNSANVRRVSLPSISEITSASLSLVSGSVPR